MDQNITDGNSNNAEIVGSESSPVQESQTNEGIDANTASADSVNTDDKVSQYIPKSRFNEVNNELKKYKERESQFQTQSELLRAAEELETVLKSDPDLAQAITATIQQRQKQSQEPKSQTPDDLYKSLAQEVHQMKAEKIATGFLNMHNQNLETVQEQFRSAVDEIVADKVQAMVGRDVTRLTPQQYNAAFKQAVEIVKPFMSAPVQTQSAPNVPSPMRSNPVSPATKLDHGDRNARVAFIANSLRAANKT